MSGPSAPGSRRLALRIAAGLMLAGYLMTGIFTVPANQVGVVRRFGRAVFPVRTSGLHYDLPWPWVKIDRVNLNAVHTMTLGEATDEANAFLSSASNQPTTFLTGDRNLLQLRIGVQYRISEEFLAEWLYGSTAPERRLKSLVETTVTDLVSQCGVDFVHTQGLAELNNRLLIAVRTAARNQRLGCDVEQVTIDRAEPPPRVKAEFLDVSNARADLARSINEARAYAEQRLAESQADARQLVDTAIGQRGSMISAAQGSADRFQKLVKQIEQDASMGGREYAVSRNLTLNRLYLETVREILGKVKSKVVLDGPTDLSMPRSTGH
ncbi:MAG: protease modulator HflK [Planctomycetota bacterium]